MFDVGRVCFKLAGRDANNYCVIIEKVDDNFVMVDGQTRRKKVNVKHLEPTRVTMDIKEGADHSHVVEAFAKHNIEIPMKKPKKAAEKPKKQKAVKEKKQKPEKKPSKKEAKSEPEAENKESKAENKKEDKN